MTLRQRQSAFSRDIAQLLTHATTIGFEYTFGEFERPIEMQRIHMAAGRSKTMNSSHLMRCAADIHFFNASGTLCYPPEIGAYWESLDAKNSWGGNWQSFKDAPHFERRV